MSGEILGPQSGGSYFEPKSHNGHLIIVTAVHMAKVEYDSVRHAEVEKLDVDIHCFNCGGASAPERKRIGNPYIVPKIRRDGNLTLGYVGMTEPKPGNKDGAWILVDPAEEDIAPASAWWENVKRSVVQAPVSRETPAPPPAPAQASAWDSKPAPTPAPQADAWAVPATPPTPPAKPHPDEVRSMDRDSVQALVAGGVLTSQEAAFCGHEGL